MARKKVEVVIREDDKDLRFEVLQMPATAGFLFGAKVAKFVCENTAKPEGNEDLVALFVKAIGGVNMANFETLMNEALESCTYVGGVAHQVCTRDALDGILTDPANVMKLLQESLKVNLAFIERAIPARFLEKMRGAVQQAEASLPNPSMKDAKSSAS